MINNTACLWQPYCPGAPLSQVKAQMLVFMGEELLRTILNSSAQTLLCVKKSPLWNCLIPSLLVISTLWLPIPYQWRCKAPSSCCFLREWLYGFELSFKTPRVHISTPLKIGTLRWRLNQRGLSESNRVSWWLQSTQTDNNNCPPFITPTPRW